MAAISLEHVVKRYPDGTEAVRDLNLNIADGEFIVFVGPSGCGKSTALNMIAGLEDISSGELKMGGKVVNQLSPKDRDIAMVFQTYALYPHMTVRQNMAFPLKIAHVPQDESDRRVKEAAELLELTDHLDRKPANLSGGQRQRVAMGRAIVRDPQAFLMDEPLSNLDAKLRVQMRTMISRLQQRLKVTTIYVTHDQTEAMTLGDRIMVLRLGVMQQVGTPQELYDYPANLFVAGFIGSPSMNFMPGQLADGVVKWPLGDVRLPAEFASRLAEEKAPRDVIVGIRPENFEDAALLEDAKREKGATVKVKPDVIESLGSEVLAYFPVPKPEAAQMEELQRVAQEVGSGDAPGSESTFVARLDPASRAREGAEFNLWLDTHKLHLFDAQTGKVLGR
ncbi:MAG TPA: sn-glycerol-3-phosphate ABC transporter ATP-binding protein UgpC [Trebonia sp.]|jgi:multiple sugar transport system ATP-binding protein